MLFLVFLHKITPNCNIRVYKTTHFRIITYSLLDTNLLPLWHIHDGSLWFRFLFMLHASHGVLIGSVTDGQDVWVEVRECRNELLLGLIYLAVDMPMAVALAEVAVLALRCVVAVAEPPVLAFVGQRVLVFPSRTAYEVERDVFYFLNRHTFRMVRRLLSRGMRCLAPCLLPNGSPICSCRH